MRSSGLGVSSSAACSAWLTCLVLPSNCFKETVAAGDTDMDSHVLSPGWLHVFDWLESEPYDLSTRLGQCTVLMILNNHSLARDPISSGCCTLHLIGAPKPFRVRCLVPVVFQQCSWKRHVGAKLTSIILTPPRIPRGNDIMVHCCSFLRRTCLCIYAPLESERVGNTVVGESYRHHI